MCLSDEYLDRYRSKLLKEGYMPHMSNNKLRDTADKYADGGRVFSFNSDIMFTYDICGNCEAHALLFAVEKGLAKATEDAPTLDENDKYYSTVQYSTVHL